MDTLLEGAKTILALPRHLHRAGDAIESIEHRACVLRLLEHEPIALLALAERFLDAPALADIPVDTLVPDRFARRVPEQPCPALEGHDTPIPPDRLESEDLRQLFPREHPAHALLAARERLGCDQLTDIASDQRLSGPLECLLRCAVDADDGAVQAGGDDEITRVLEESAEARFALAKARLGPPAPRALALEGFDAPSQRLDLCRESRSSHAHSPLPTGSVKVQVEPVPASPFTQILPPWSSLNFRERAR